VNRTRSGGRDKRLTTSTARSKARVPVGLGGPWKPTWVSLSWTKVKGVAASPFRSAILDASSAEGRPEPSPGNTR
jgi:hypothetical protein